MDTTKGWKTKTAAILGGVAAIAGAGIYVLAGADAPGAMEPGTALFAAIGAFGVFGGRDAAQKMIDAIKGQ